MAGLTSQQHRLLEFIREYDERTGFSPSFDEMKQALGLASKSGVARLVTALVAKGKLRKSKGMARSLEIVDGRNLAHVSTLDLRRELARRTFEVAA